jgi:hypothetical protein
MVEPAGVCADRVLQITAVTHCRHAAVARAGTFDSFPPQGTGVISMFGRRVMWCGVFACAAKLYLEEKLDELQRAQHALLMREQSGVGETAGPVDCNLKKPS